MLDRESTFADPDIIEMLQNDFVPVAIDQQFQRRQKDAEGEFYRKIASQGPRGDFTRTTQGLYISAPDGTLIAYNNNRGPERIRRIMREAISHEANEPTNAIEVGKRDPRFEYEPPDGGSIIQVRAKILDGYPEPETEWQSVFQNAISRDNMWITKKEIDTISRGELPPSLAMRIARFHMIDNTRGEPPMWRSNEVIDLDLRLTDEKIEGRIHVETDDDSRGFDGQLLGYVSVEDGELTKFDLIVEGDYWGHGRYTRNPPPGRFPIAFCFNLADGNDTADHVPPQGARFNLRDYLGN